MFETREDVMSMFEQFRSVDKVDLGSCRALENHALLVMNALDEAIANMDDEEFLIDMKSSSLTRGVPRWHEEFLIDMLLTTGKSHRRFDNFSANIFWVIKH